MQTFMPFSDFKKSAKVLDRARLGKQRVETLQIMKTLLDPAAKQGWKNHPAVKMWQGYEKALLEYQKAICSEWLSRGYKDTCLEKTKLIYTTTSKHEKLIFPSWLGEEKFHASHRSNLLRKNPIWYNQYNWSETNDLEYVWPTQAGVAQ